MSIATIYCKPYIAHWLFHRYGNPVELPRDSKVRIGILSCLSKQYFPHSAYNKTLYPELVEIKMHKDLFSEIGHSLTLSQQHMVNDLVNELIEAEIYLKVTALHVNGINIDEAIIKYQQSIKATEKNFKAETIRTKYFRYKRNLNKIFLTFDTPAS